LRDLERLSGINNSNLSRLERGQRQQVRGLGYIDRLATALGVSVADLLRET